MPFCLEKAEKVKRLCESLVFSKGKWAGRPFRLLPWQWEQVIKPLFGTLRDDGLRQYRFCYVEIPKKNGKTELAAGIANYMLFIDQEPGAEIYSAASTRDQASICFRVAAQMVRQSNCLLEMAEIHRGTKTISLKDDPECFYRAISSARAAGHPAGSVPSRFR